MSITGIKGMNDILPGDVETWQHLEAQARRVFGAFGYREIRVPVVEKTDLFCRSIGETTDIVEKEMYTFSDKGGTSMTLRPEGTAPVMRAFIQHKLYAKDPVSKLYYIGPMFRHERPQKGRYRQFHQIGAEVIGVDDPKIDAQVLVMLSHYFATTNIPDVALQINSLGCPECRPAYREALIKFLEQRLPELCADCQRRYTSNPLRVLDCKVPGCKEATVEAPAMLDNLCIGCDTHFSQVKEHLDELSVDYTVNQRMVRGLDYYTKTTFEMVTNSLGAQNAVAAGGRYDGLISDLGGPKLPGIGFAIGLERLALMLGEQSIAPPRPELFIATLGEAGTKAGFAILTRLQRQGILAEMEYTGKSLKAQLRRADKLKTRRVLILGEDELSRGVAQLRYMDESIQEEVALDGLETRLLNEINSEVNDA
ncbi:MAG: histidine--tRNA ligase [Deltaproteobacteria bacterium]|nr:MAG: histidine--tRNA ligase [Deltaproteobacteria bacterium]